MHTGRTYNWFSLLFKRVSVLTFKQSFMMCVLVFSGVLCRSWSISWWPAAHRIIRTSSNTLLFAPLAARLLLLPWCGSRSLSSLWLLPLVFLFDLSSDWTTFEVQLRVPPAFSPLWILTRASATGAIIIHSFNRLPVLVFEFQSYKQPSTNLTAENTNKHTLSDRDKVC